MTTATTDEERALDALHDVIDPELGIDVVDLGLVYELEVKEGAAHLVLGVTTPSCPFSASLAEEARAVLSSLPDVATVEVRLTTKPAWSPEMMSAQARRLLGWER